jgi:hypothetical protein
MCGTSIICNWIVDQIPLWGWFIIFGAPIGALLFYFGPVLLPIWRMLPGPVRGVMIAAGVGLLAWLGGRHKGRQNAEEEERRRNAEALKKRTEVDHEIGSMSGGQVENRLRDRWTRDGP